MQTLNTTITMNVYNIKVCVIGMRVYTMIILSDDILRSDLFRNLDISASVLYLDNSNESTSYLV